MPVESINSYDEFKTAVNGPKPAVIDFWATWCGPCKAIAPIFEQLSALEAFQNVGFYKVDVDSQRQVAQEVGVRAMPTFALYNKGEKVETAMGAHPSKLQDLVKKASSL